jgi:ATP-dependent protease HslVU (ClpYQ) peptidase subunit
VRVRLRQAYSRVGVACDLSEVKADVLAMGSGGEYGITGTKVCADDGQRVGSA